MPDQDDYWQLVAVHSPRFGTGIKRKNSYRQQWLRRRKARLLEAQAGQADDQTGMRPSVTLPKSLEVHPGQTEGQTDGQ